MKLKLIIVSAFVTFQLTPFAQRVGEVRTVKAMLTNVMLHGDQHLVYFSTTDTLFLAEDTTGWLDFDDMSWLDGHLDIYDFYHAYRDFSYHLDSIPIWFTLTLIYIPIEQYHYERYEGYIPYGEIANQWVLTSVVRTKQEEEETNEE